MHYVKLNVKFYIVAVLLLAITIVGIYGIYYLNTNTILRDDKPISVEDKTILTVLISIVVFSWLMSFFIILRQIIRGYAFKVDEAGVHSTLSVTIFLSLIIVVPVTYIPFDGIVTLDEEYGVLRAKLEKSKIDLPAFLRPFLRSKFYFFNGYRKESNEEIRNMIKSYSRILLN